MGGTVRCCDLSQLQPNERAAVQAFTDQLRAQFGERIARTVLFGSKAHDDSGSDSDIDILVVVDAVDRRFEAQVSSIASGLDLKYDVLLNTHLLTRERWEDYTRRQAARWLNVQRDGIELQFPIAVQ
jgi:predicted nucleotidyltransferase